MGTSSSGLLDEAKVNHIKELVGKRFQNFSEFYRLQYTVTYLGHIHQEVEPKKEGRGLFLTHRPKYDPEEVLYQGSVKFSCWDEQGKKCRERCVVLRRDFRVEIHDSTESLSRGCAAKLVLQPARGIVFTNEEESRAYLEKSCAAILNGVKEDSSVASSSDEFAVYLHLPHTGHSCFLFQQEEERDNFLSGLKTCIRHRNLDPWCDSSHESQAYAQALSLYQQDKGCYESWEKLLGTEEQVLASQVMEEVLPWLHNQLQTKVKGKKTERIRQWLATVQATYTLVLEQLTAALEVQREECRQRASASQTLIRSNLDQIIASQDFLEQKVRACICKEAEDVCNESIVPYMSSILEVLTEHIGAGILGMQHTLKTQMNSSFSLTNGGTDDTLKVLSGLRSVSLDQNYTQVENLAEKLEDLKQRFGLSSTQRLVHSAQLEMEQLLDSAVYTLEQFLQSSTRLQPLQVSVKMEKAKERVLKQLDHDSRVVQRKLYLEALLEITLPSLVKKMDTKWKTELQQFEQYIFSDYSDLILVQNIYDDVLRSILSKEIETVVQDAASNESNNLLLDTSDLAISQYSLLGQTPPLSAPDSPAARPRPSSSSSVVSGGNPDAAAVVEEESTTPDVSPQNDEEETESDPSQTSERSSVLQSPVIVVTQQIEDPETREEENAAHSAAAESTGQSTAAEPDGAAAAQEVDMADTQPDPGSKTLDSADPGPKTPDSADPGSKTPDSADPGPKTPDSADPGPKIPDSADPGPKIPDSADPGPKIPDSADPGPITPDSADPGLLVLVRSNNEAECSQSDYTWCENTATADLLTSDQILENPPSPTHSLRTDCLIKISLGSLSEAVAPCSTEPAGLQVQNIDRAIYLTGQIKDNWERAMEGNQKEAAEKEETKESREEDEAQTHASAESCRLCSSPGESAFISTTEPSASEERLDDETGAELDGEMQKEEVEAAEETKKDPEREVLHHPECGEELLPDSVAVIRELVTEITEVEIMIPPCSTSSPP